MKGGGTRQPTGRSGPQAPLRAELGDVREPLIVRTDLVSSAAALPPLVRPNDPLIAADVRAMAHEIIAECLEAGSAEVVSEVAMPLQAHALALLLDLSADHADEWISWGVEALDYDDDAGAARSVTEYVDRQLINARRSRERNFFAALDRAEVAGRRLDFDTRRRFTARLLSDGRARAVAVLAAALDWLASEPGLLHRLRVDRDFAARSVDSLLGALPEVAADGPVPASLGRRHARLVLRALLAVIAAHVERLTVVRRQLRTDAHPLEWHTLLIAFLPRDGGD